MCSHHLEKYGVPANKYYTFSLINEKYALGFPQLTLGLPVLSMSILSFHRNVIRSLFDRSLSESVFFTNFRYINKNYYHFSNFLPMLPAIRG